MPKKTTKREAKEVSQNKNCIPLLGIIVALLAASAGIYFLLPQQNSEKSTGRNEPLAPEKDLDFPILQSARTNKPTENCGERMERFIFGSDKYKETVRFFAVKDHCKDKGIKKVAPFYNKVYARFVATELCFINEHPQSRDYACSAIKNIFQSPKKLTQFSAADIADPIFVQEGECVVASNTTTLVTARISVCVGVALTNPQSEEVLMAHINHQNMLAADEFLQGKMHDPFAFIQSFLEKRRSEGWSATLISGQQTHAQYVKTTLEEMGIRNVRIYCDTRWAQVYSVAEKPFLNGGSLVIQKGKVGIIKNPKPFMGQIRILSKEMHNKPMLLQCSNHSSKKIVSKSSEKRPTPQNQFKLSHR